MGPCPKCGGTGRVESARYVEAKGLSESALKSRISLCESKLASARARLTRATQLKVHRAREYQSDNDEIDRDYEARGHLPDWERPNLNWDWYFGEPERAIMSAEDEISRLSSEIELFYRVLEAR